MKKDEIETLIRKSLVSNSSLGHELQELENFLSISNSYNFQEFQNHLFDISQIELSRENGRMILQNLENILRIGQRTLQKESSKDRVFFSPGEDCLDAILYQMKLCRQTMDICLFTISDNRISEQIIEVAERGVMTRIITDNDKIFDQGSDIRQLHNAGIEIKVDNTDYHMHHKFAIFDTRTCITGSYNWTRSAALYNHENILISQNLPVISSFQKEFNSLWNELVDYSAV